MHEPMRFELVVHVDEFEKLPGGRQQALANVVARPSQCIVLLNRSKASVPRKQIGFEQDGGNSFAGQHGGSV